MTSATDNIFVPATPPPEGRTLFAGVAYFHSINSFQEGRLIAKRPICVKTRCAWTEYSILRGIRCRLAATR